MGNFINFGAFLVVSLYLPCFGLFRYYLVHFGSFLCGFFFVRLAYICVV